VLNKAPGVALDLEVDMKTKEVLLSVDKFISTYLKPHQEEGVRFLWNSCFGTMLDDKPGGCILAHMMGLGKSLQVS
jgi:transcriptional regulator ATRX